MSSTFDVVAKVISETSEIPLEQITPEAHAIDDLGIDSLDFLDIVFALDKKFGIKIPLERWTEEVNEGRASVDDYFVLKNSAPESTNSSPPRTPDRKLPMRLEYFDMIDSVDVFDAEKGHIETTSRVPQTKPGLRGPLPDLPDHAGRAPPRDDEPRLGPSHARPQQLHPPALLRRSKRVKIRRFVTPGQVMKVTVDLVHEGSGFCVTKGQIKGRHRAHRRSRDDDDADELPDARSWPPRFGGARRSPACSPR